MPKTLHLAHPPLPILRLNKVQRGIARLTITISYTCFLKPFNDCLSFFKRYIAAYRNCIYAMLSVRFCYMFRMSYVYGVSDAFLVC